MRRIWSFIAIPLLTLLAPSAQALTLAPPSYLQNSLSTEGQQMLAAFFRDVETKLPKEVHKKLLRTITVDFAVIDGIRELRFSCDNETYGNLPQWQNPYEKIELHRSFLLPLASGAAKNLPASCRHETVYKLALATLLHEIMHIYDLENPLDREELQYLRDCRQDEASQSDYRCTHLHNKEGRISGKERFLHLTGWEAPYGRITRANEFPSRSADTYEFKNPKEAFAVNMEYFLLDPDFACRRPALFGFFKEYFGDPFPARTCALSVHVTNEFSELMALDRVAEVHLLLAAPGESAASRFGHVMFRLVICAPHRETVGPECINDILYHRVISARASVGDVSYSSFAGLTGKYSSRFYNFSFIDALRDYTRNELRDLYSYPLRLSPEQKQNFLAAALEVFWMYEGKYYFISRNCAVESLALLKRAFGESALQWATAMTPFGLKSELERLGIIEDKPIQYNSKRLVLEKAAQLVFGGKNAFSRATSSNLAARMRLADDLSSRSVPRIAAFVALEDLLISRKQQDLEKKFTESAADENFGEIVRDFFSLPTLPGYGVPLKNELEIAQAQSDAYLARQNAAIETLHGWAQKKFPEEFAEIRKMEEFRARLVALLAQKLP